MCSVCCFQVGILFVGVALIFKKTQDKFILYYKESACEETVIEAKANIMKLRADDDRNFYPERVCQQK